MEELLGVVLQIIAEILFDAALGLFGEAASSYGLPPKPERTWWLLRCAGLFAFGLLIGWISWGYLPRFLIGRPWLRLVNLVVAPLLAGYGAATLAERRRDRGDKTVRPYRHFLFAASVSFGAVLARLAMGLR